MAMTLSAKVIGTHVLAFPEGGNVTVAGSGGTGAAGRNRKPDSTDPLWVDLGVIEEASDNLSDTEIEIYSPSPGRLRLYDVINVKDKLTMKFTCSEFGPTAVEVLYRTLALTTVSTQFNPLEGTTKKFWLKFQRYDQADAQAIVLDVWARLKIDGDVSFGGADLTKAAFEALVLHSQYNTGTL